MAEKDIKKKTLFDDAFEQAVNEITPTIVSFILDYFPETWFEDKEGIWGKITKVFPFLSILIARVTPDSKQWHKMDEFRSELFAEMRRQTEYRKKYGVPQEKSRINLSWLAAVIPADIWTDLESEIMKWNDDQKMMFLDFLRSIDPSKPDSIKAFVDFDATQRVAFLNIMTALKEKPSQKKPVFTEERIQKIEKAIDDATVTIKGWRKKINSKRQQIEARRRGG